MTAYSIDGFETQVLTEEVVAKEIGNEDVDALRRGLRDGREPVRANSVAGLGFRKDVDASVVMEIAVLLRDGSPKVRLAAARTLGRLGTEPVGTIPRMLLVLRVAEDDFHDALVDAINAYDDIGGLLQDALDQPGDRILPSLAAVAEPHDDLLVDLWLEVLEDDHRSFRARANAAELLKRLGLTDDDDIAEAVAEFENEGADVRERNNRTSTFDRRLPQVMEPEPIEVEGFYETELSGKDVKAAAKSDPDKLRRALHDGRDIVRLNAARAIGEMGKSAAPLVGELAVRVRDGSSRVGMIAAESLGKLKLDAGVVIPALGRALSTENSILRKAILDAIDSFGKAGATQFLAAFEEEPDERNARLLTLAARRRPDDYTEPLAKLMSDSDRTKVRARAAQVLSRLGPAAKKAKPALLAVLDEDEAVLRIRALDALGRIGDADKKVIKRITALAKEDERPSVRYATRSALERLGAEFPEEEE